MSNPESLASLRASRPVRPDTAYITIGDCTCGEFGALSDGLCSECWEQVQRDAMRDYADRLEAALEAHEADADVEIRQLDPGMVDLLRVVRVTGPATWEVTEALTPDQHGAELTRMIHGTRERYGQPDGPTEFHWLSVDGDRSLAMVGTSPLSPVLARALTGAWNRLLDDAQMILGRIDGAEG